jgi:DNA-binding NarL/FixJ family response regulator
MVPAKLLLIESHPSLARLLREALLKESGLELIGEANSARAALALLEVVNPDVVILDLNLTDMCGLEVIPLLLKRASSSRVILLIDQDDQRYYQTAVRKGAWACIRKALVATDLVPTVKRALAENKVRM